MSSLREDRYGGEIEGLVPVCATPVLWRPKPATIWRLDMLRIAFIPLFLLCNIHTSPGTCLFAV